MSFAVRYEIKNTEEVKRHYTSCNMCGEEVHQDAMRFGYSTSEFLPDLAIPNVLCLNCLKRALLEPTNLKPEELQSFLIATGEFTKNWKPNWKMTEKQKNVWNYINNES
jgi:hypothetical protein